MICSKMKMQRSAGGAMISARNSHAYASASEHPVFTLVTTLMAKRETRNKTRERVSQLPSGHAACMSPSTASKDDHVPHSHTQRTVLGVLVVVGFAGVDLLAVEVLALEVAGRGALRRLVSSVGQVHHCQRVCRSVAGHAVCCPTKYSQLPRASGLGLAYPRSRTCEASPCAPRTPSWWTRGRSRALPRAGPGP